jgi:Ca2+/H+ antiporter
MPGGTEMMPGIDFGALVLGLLTLLVQLVLLIIAFVCGTTSLRRSASAAGLKPAFIAIGICAAVGGWQVLFFTPWRFPNARPYLWMPFVPLSVAASAATLWLMRRWRPSGTLALMAVVATIALTMAGGVFLQRWDRRRDSLYWARAEDEQAGSFLAAALISARCEQHSRRGERCELCQKSSPESNQYNAIQFRKYAEDAAIRAKFLRQRADAW